MLLKINLKRKNNEINQNLNNIEDFKKDGILKEEELDSPLLLANKIEKSKIDYKELKMKIGENLVKIMKNELYVDKKKFFLTSSALLLLKIIYDYLHIVEYFPSIAYDSVVKLFEIVKVIKTKKKIKN